MLDGPTGGMFRMTGVGVEAGVGSSLKDVRFVSSVSYKNGPLSVTVWAAIKQQKEQAHIGNALQVSEVWQ